MSRLRLFVHIAKAIRRSNRGRHLAGLLPRNFVPLPEIYNDSQYVRICRECSNRAEPDCIVDDIIYDRACNETLNALTDYFEELTENATDLTGADVIFGDGVLSINLGSDYGVYVINRQRPNKQIWLSSPTTGPKRFDYILQPGQKEGNWVYKHTGVTLHQVLQEEITKIIKSMPVNFMKLPHHNC